jgi:uncharacterized protein with von Willebrand factor type A (vWA) domain
MKDEENVDEQVEQGEQVELPKGFISKEEWVAKGRPEEDWRDPEEWQKRGDEILPIVKKERDELRKEITNLKGDIDKIISFNNRQEQRLRQEGYQQALKDIESKRDEAIEDGDKETVKKLDKDRDKIVTAQAQDAAIESTPSNINPQFEIDFKDFRERNPWYQSDEELTKEADSAAMVGMFEGLIKDGKTYKQAFEEVEKNIKLKFSDKFENTNRNKASAVETEAGSRSSKSNGKGINSIKDSSERKKAKDSFERIKKQFALKGVKYTESEYMADY